MAAAVKAEELPFDVAGVYLTEDLKMKFYLFEIEEEGTYSMVIWRFRISCG